MRKKSSIITLLFLSVCILLSFFFFLSPVYGVKDISAGMRFPQFNLDTSEATDSKQYLCLKNSRFFSISQIPAKFILIEVFSLYCPMCHKQGPILKRLFKFIQQNPELSKDIKMIGIGTGNNRKEIEIYKAKYNIPFPLFSDPHFKIHKKLGEPRTPFTIVVDKSGKVLFTHFGVIENEDEFMSKIKNLNDKRQ